MKNEKRNIWIARILIFVVTFFNIQAAYEFMFRGHLYNASFEVSGVPGVNLIRGLGLLFLMWNIPYIFALVRPIRNRISLYEAVIMQAIGVIGESYLLWRLPEGYETLASSVVRFIIFDGSGLVLLLGAVVVTWRVNKTYRSLK